MTLDRTSLSPANALIGVGPILGSLLATGFYGLLKLFDYEEATPGQDKADDPEWDANGEENGEGEDGNKNKEQTGRKTQHGSGGKSNSQRRGSGSQDGQQTSPPATGQNSGRNNVAPSSWNQNQGYGQDGPPPPWAQQQAANSQGRQRVSRREIEHGTR